MGEVYDRTLRRLGDLRAGLITQQIPWSCPRTNQQGVMNTGSVFKGRIIPDQKRPPSEGKPRIKNSEPKLRTAPSSVQNQKWVHSLVPRPMKRGKGLGPGGRRLRHILLCGEQRGLKEQIRGRCRGSLSTG
ncbi:hypothetical protein JOQ06_027870, partial [Pogonophryne albipinna]